MEPLLVVEGLKKYFEVRKSFLETLVSRKREFIKAVDGISFEVGRGEVFGLVGESGCGKTTTGRVILRLEEPTEGRAFFDGIDLFALNGEELRKMRRRMQIIFQDPYASLNPRMKVGEIIAHPLKIHGLSEGREKDTVLELLEMVGLTPAEDFYNSYPHQLSGGQRQRVAIARALILHPEFIVADEPVSMLDVSVRATILDLMMKLKEKMGLTYLFITHDLATAKYVCNRVAVMYLGKIVEMGSIDRVFEEPLHPYTKALLSAIPVPNPTVKRERLVIGGEVPNPINPPPGCRFHPRCPFATERCKQEEPQLVEVEKGHKVACHLAA